MGGEILNEYGGFCRPFLEDGMREQYYFNEIKRL